jgi:hypothetical protein
MIKNGLHEMTVVMDGPSELLVEIVCVEGEEGVVAWNEKKLSSANHLHMSIIYD